MCKDSCEVEERFNERERRPQTRAVKFPYIASFVESSSSSLSS